MSRRGAQTSKISCLTPFHVGETRGFRRTRDGYSALPDGPKWVFIRPLAAQVQTHLSRPVLDPRYRHGAPKMMLTAEQMRSLPEFVRRVFDYLWMTENSRPRNSAPCVEAG